MSSFQVACSTSIRLLREVISQTVRLISLWLVHTSQQQVQELRHKKKACGCVARGNQVQLGH
eukprot:1143445-Pelagomonas_calceolata.AAC.2